MLDIFTILDKLSFAFLKKRIDPESDWSVNYFNVPKVQRLRFEDEQKKNLQIYKYPSHYKHHPFLEYRSAFLFYFSIFGTLSTNWFIKALRSKKVFGSVVFGFFSVSSFIEAKYAFERVKDIKSVILKDEKTLVIKTFQDEDINYEFDVSEIKVANKNIEEILVLVDKNRVLNKKPVYFICEPSPGCVFNQFIFDVVLKDRRYLKYNV